MPIDVCTFIERNNNNIDFQYSAISGIANGNYPESEDEIIKITQPDEGEEIVEN